jgi:hypothetical protein
MAKRQRASLLAFLMCALLVVGLPSAGAAAPPTPPPGGPGDVSSSPPDFSRPSRPATPDELRQGRARLAPASDTVVRDVVVSNTDTTLASGGSGGSEPSVAVNPANPNQMVISSFFGGWGANSSVFGTTDGGQNWTVYNSVPAPPGQAGVSGCPCDQTFDFGRNGTLYGTFLLADSFGNTNVVTGSTTDFTQASSWSWNGNPVQLTNQARANNADQPWLVVNRDTATASQDNAYVGYDEFTNNLAQVAGSTGSMPVTITRDVRAGNESPNVTNPGLRLAADPRIGTMYALYQTSTGSAQPRMVTYHLNRSTDAGQNWTLNGNADGLTVATVPSDQLRYKFGGVNDLRGGVDHAAVDPTNGDVYVVYGHDTANTGVGNQLKIRRLTANGSGLTVGAASVVTNASSAALPSVAVAGDGTIGVLFDTFDGTTTDGFPTFSAHFSRSTDHGATFIDQVLQTFNSPVKPSGNNTDRQRIFGDYQQLKAVGRTFNGVFSGNRAGFGGSTISTIDPIFFSVSVRAPSTTALTSSANPSVFGQAVTFTAAVSSAGGTPTGNVTFRSDGSPLGSPVGLTGGLATLQISALPSGTHTVTADYGGDANLAPSTGSLTQTVNKAPTTTALTSSINPSRSGQAVTFTATVASAGATATGTVTFANDANTLGTVSLASGQATLTTSALAVGDHTITATYTGDTNLLASDTTLTQTTNPPLEGLTDPNLNPLMNALSNTITDSTGGKILGLNPPCAMTGPYQGLSDIDKLIYSRQANDGCLQFVTSF